MVGYSSLLPQTSWALAGQASLTMVNNRDNGGAVNILKMSSSDAENFDML